MDERRSGEPAHRSEKQRERRRSGMTVGGASGEMKPPSETGVASLQGNRWGFRDVFSPTS